MNSQQRWLEVQADPGTCVYTLSRCLTLADLQADGDYKLVLADMGGAQYILKVLKGTGICAETTLPELPSGVVSLYNDVRSPRIPLIAVASGPSIYLYRNLKPYYKFSIPPLDVNALEQDLWIQARDARMEPKALYEMLQSIQQEIGFSKLSQQSQKLLSVPLDKEEEVKTVVSNNAQQPLVRRTVITCLATLKKNSSDADALACLVLGSEDGALTFVDTEAFIVIDSIQQCEDHGSRCVPVSIHTSGLLDVEFRVVTCNRDGKITLLRRSWKHSKVLVQLAVHPVDMVMLDNSQIVLATNNSLECYTKKGRRQWEQPLQGTALGLSKITLDHLGLTLVAVAADGGSVFLYNGRDLVDIVVAPETVCAMSFGRFGQEDHCFILVTVGGILIIKILKRTAQFTPTPSMNAVQTVPRLPLPKKTRLLVEQVARERDNALEIHQGFQRGLFRLRLHAARELASSLERTSNLLSGNTQLPLKMSAQVFGLGPIFKVRLSLDNMAPNLNDASLRSRHLQIVFHYNHQLYRVAQPVLDVPLLVPGLVYILETTVTTIGDVLVAEDVLVFLVSSESHKPILAASVHIPVCDLLPIEI